MSNLITRKVSYRKLYIFFISLYLVCIPLNAINIGSAGSALKYLSILPIGLAIIGAKNCAIKSPEKWQLAFTIFAFFSLSWSVYIESSIDRVISYTSLLLLLLSADMLRYSKEELNIVKQSLVWSSRFTALIVFIFADFYEGRLRLVNSYISEDPNYLSGYYAFGIIFCVSILVKKNKMAFKWIALLELGLYGFLIFCSGTRGGLIAIIAGIVVFLLTLKEKNAKQDTIRKTIFIVLLVLTFIFTFDYLPDSLKTRFTIDNVYSDGGSGRTEIWRSAWDLYHNSNTFRLFFGYGTASILWSFAHYGAYEVIVVHNIFLETLVELGLIGFTLYCFAIFSFVKQAYHYGDKFAFAVICCMVVLSLSTSIYTFKPYFHIMLFIVMCGKVDNVKESAYILKNNA